MDYYSHEVPRTVETAVNYTVKIGDDRVHATAACTITLYSAVGRKRRVTILRTYMAGAVTTVAAKLGETINGVASKNLAAQWNTLTLYTHNGAWYIE